MRITRLRSYQDFLHHADRNGSSFLAMQAFENSLIPRKKKPFTVRGISYPAMDIVPLQVDYQYAAGDEINWRERLVCPVTGLNSRLRASLHVFDMEMTPYPDSSIYITEQVTPLFSLLKTKYPALIGSEFLGAGYRPGQVVNGVRHEDMGALSLGDASLERYLSFECFEHIPFYKNSIKEIYRTLRPGGGFLGSFPFDLHSASNIIKARLNVDGTIEYFGEPEYHGDPTTGKGILCYTVFGWQLLDEFRAIGFSDAYVLLIWSDVFGYLGGEQIFFIAKK